MSLVRTRFRAVPFLHAVRAAVSGAIKLVQSVLSLLTSEGGGGGGFGVRVIWSSHVFLFSTP